MHETNIGKAEALYSFFIKQSQLTNDAPELPTYTPPQYPPLEIVNINSQDVHDILRKLNTSKASGPDLINPRLLREAAVELCGPLSQFFNKLIQEETFPLDYKKSNVVPIHKKGDRSLPNNYRPISLLSIIGKSMERCIHKYVYNYCVTNKVITPFQSGFVHGDSTIYQLTDMYNSFCEAIDSGKEVRVVFCHISKAFD